MPRPNKGPRLERNEYGVYEIRWSAAGRSKRVSTGTDQIQEAQRFLAGWILEADRSAAPTLDVNAVIAHYEREHLDAGKAASADDERRRFVQVRAFFGDYMVGDIDAQAVNEFVRRRRAGKLGRKVVDGTIRRELTSLIAAINLAARDRKIQRDDVPHIPLPAGSEPRDYWLKPDELDRLMAAAQPADAKRLTRAYRFVAIARYTAARKAAIERLTWFQVDIENLRIDFREPGARLSKKRKVAVPISDELAVILRQAQKERKNEFVLDHPGAIRKTFETAAREAGLPDVTPHTLRHTWATLAAQRGADLWAIAGVLGDTMATVERNYLKHCPDHLRGVVNSGRNLGITPDPGAKTDQHRPTSTASDAVKG